MLHREQARGDLAPVERVAGLVKGLPGNAAREVVSEIAIYRRERMVNLSIFNYMASKFILLSALCVVQCTVLLGIVYSVLKLGHGTFDAFFPMLGTMVLSSMCAVALGLLISAAVTSSEAAMAP
jgi:hypothetical protein